MSATYTTRTCFQKTRLRFPTNIPSPDQCAALAARRAGALEEPQTSHAAAAGRARAGRGRRGRRGGRRGGRRQRRQRVRGTGPDGRAPPLERGGERAGGDTLPARSPRLSWQPFSTTLKLTLTCPPYSPQKNKKESHPHTFLQPAPGQLSTNSATPAAERPERLVDDRGQRSREARQTGARAPCGGGRCSSRACACS
jgi:hypothetical protein